MFYFIRKTMDEHTHADGTTHTHADGTTHSHEGNEHAEDQFNAKKEMLLKLFTFSILPFISPRFTTATQYAYPV